MKTLRRWSGVIKRRVRRVCEVKAGILLSRPVGKSAPASSANAVCLPSIQRTDEYRESLPWPEHEFARRLEGGNALYELFVDGRPVCYGWVAEAGTRVGVLHDLHLVVPERGFYVWDCATAPAFRGNGHFRALLHGMNHKVYPTATLALVAVDTGNGPSRRALASAGFRPVFTYISVRLMKRPLFSVAFISRKIVAAQPEFDRLGDLCKRA